MSVDTMRFIFLKDPLSIGNVVNLRFMPSRLVGDMSLPCARFSRTSLAYGGMIHLIESAAQRATQPESLFL